MLTKRAIEALQPEAKRYRVADLQQRGLKIVVEPSGRKYWTVKYVMLDGRESEKVLGEWPGLLIDQARIDAGLVRARINRQQADPAEEVRRTRHEAEQERIAEAKAREETFAKLADAYIQATKRGFRAPRQRHRKAPSTVYREEKVLLKHVVPKFGTRPISEIKRRDIDFPKFEAPSRRGGEQRPDPTALAGVGARQEGPRPCYIPSPWIGYAHGRSTSARNPS